MTGAARHAICTGCLSITTKPTVISTDMNFLGRGDEVREVTIRGSAFQPGAVVKINGVTSSSTSYIDSTTLEALVTVSPRPASASVLVTVTNPDAGKGSCSGCFTIVDSPKVTSLSTTTFTRGTTVSVTVNGSNFTGRCQDHRAFRRGLRRRRAGRRQHSHRDRVDLDDGTARHDTILSVVNARAGGYGAGIYSPLTVN